MKKAADLNSNNVFSGAFQAAPPEPKHVEPTTDRPMTSRYGIELPTRLLDVARDAAVAKNISLKDVFVEALEDYIAKVKGELGGSIPSRQAQKLRPGRRL